MLGASPKDLILVGVVGECFEPGRPLSHAVHNAAKSVIDTILAHLERLGVSYEKSASNPAPSVWWSDPAPHRHAKSA
jgi:hypothetical protein